LDRGLFGVGRLELNISAQGFQEVDDKVVEEKKREIDHEMKLKQRLALRSMDQDRARRMMNANNGKRHQIAQNSTFYHKFKRNNIDQDYSEENVATEN
jgi:hypothetical protein